MSRKLVAYFSAGGSTAKLAKGAKVLRGQKIACSIPLPN